MPGLITTLKNRLGNAKRVALLGIGSEIRGDDAIGIVIAQDLKTYIKKNKLKYVKVFFGGTAPENLTGEIKKFKPTHIIITDAVDFHQKPGTVKIVDIDKETGASFSTHRIPIKVMNDYLYKSIACETIIIGIQPQALGFYAQLSQKTRAAAASVTNAIGRALPRAGNPRASAR
jgi:hydrogenase 3 maturation protease